MTGEREAVVLESGFAEGRPAGFAKVAPVVIEHLHVGHRAGGATVALHTPGQLDQRAHRRRLDHCPVVIVVAADFGDRRAEHDKQVVGRVVPVEPFANIGQAEHGVGLTSVQGLIEPLLDGRADE